MFLKYRNSEKELINQISAIINEYLEENEVCFEEEVNKTIENLVEEELLKYGLFSPHSYKKDYSIPNWVVEQILEVLLECCFEECEDFLISDYDVDKLKVSMINIFIDYRIFA